MLTESFLNRYRMDKTVTLPALQVPADIWRISPVHSASRLLALITALRCLLVFDGICFLLLRASLCSTLQKNANSM